MAAITAPTTLSVNRRGMGIGILFIVLGLAILALFAFGIPLDVVSTLRWSSRTDAFQIPEMPLPTVVVNALIGLATVGLGIYQIVRGFRYANSWIGAVFGLFVLAFLFWSIKGQTLNITGLLESTLLRATPFLLGALAGILCERAGVVNIAVEGMMLFAAFVSVIVANLSGSIWLGLLAGLLSGAVIATVHAVLSIRYKVDQVISGTVINIFAAGFTSYVNIRWLQTNVNLNNSFTFDPTPIPFLRDIPIIGTILFSHNWMVYAAIIVMLILHFVLFYTRWGLRTRAVGEYPKAADTLGVDVYKMRYANVILSGVLAASAGCFLTLGSVGRFDKLMSNGRGFISLAATIFGNWTPLGAFASSLIFGFADSLQIKLQILTSVIPSEFLLMAPYLATMLILAGVVGRAQPPAADGIPYEKE